MKKVLLLLCNGVEIYEAAAFYDVLGWSGAEGLEAVQVVTAGQHRQIQCTFGLQVTSDIRLLDVQAEQFDALAIPGGFEEFGFYEDAYSDQVGELVRQFAAKNKPIASICVGALLVAHSGILRARRATTYPGRRREQLSSFGVHVVDEPIVRDGNIITSTGPGTAVEVALKLLEELTGKENAERIRRAMGFDGAIGEARLET